MAEFDEFLDEAIEAGTGRKADGTRRIPGFVPGGPSEEGLFHATVNALTTRGFNIMDIRAQGSCEAAINSFRPAWPRFSTEKPLAGQYEFPLPQIVRRLLILCGEGSLPRFWKNLRVSGALYTGAVFPPFLTMSTGCIIVPDCACVCAVIRSCHFAGMPPGSLGPVCEYTSLKAAWLG